VRVLYWRCIPCFFVLLLLISNPAHAAFEFQPTSARAGGIGDNFVAWAEGPEALFWNPGAIVWNNGIGVMGGYDRPFGISELRSSVVGLVMPVGKLAVGLSFQDFGFVLYREQVAGATVAYRVTDRLGMGLALRSLRLEVEGYGSASWTVLTWV
jgi:hypothetical protein